MTVQDSRADPRLSDPRISEPRPDPRVSARPNTAPPRPTRPEPLRAPVVERVTRTAGSGTFYVLTTVMLVLVLVAGGLALDRVGSGWMASHWPFDEAQRTDRQPDQPPVPAIDEQPKPILPLTPSGPARP